MPVSRTRTKQKKKNQFMPSSKDARQKMRRWSFVVEVTTGDTTKTFQPPALTIGDASSANAAAETIRADIANLPQFKDSVVFVKPKAEEMVSPVILNQINGLNDQSRLLTFALKRAVSDVIKAETSAPEFVDEAEAQAYSAEFERKVTERIGKYVMDEQQAQQRQRMIDAGIDPDQVLTNEMPVEQVPVEFQAAAEQGNTEPFPDGEFGKEVAA